MASLTTDGVRIQVLIQEDTSQGRYQDALYFSPGEFSNLSEEDVSALKKKRVDNWMESVIAASQIDRPAPTLEELQAQKDELQATLDSIDAQIMTIQSMN